MNKRICLWGIVWYAMLTAYAEKTVVVVTNPLDEPRVNETLAVDLKSCFSGVEACCLKTLKPAVFSESLNQFILCQVVDNDGDGLGDDLLFQADFAAGQTRRFIVSQAEPEAKINPQNASVAMYVPQRKDDFAWENDKVAFRVYGQELQRTELLSSGIDVWVKSVPYPVMEILYAKGHDYYHSDNGEGLDFYTVGTSLGCGGVGLWYKDQLLMAENYTGWKIIANGPVRSIFELTYKPLTVGDRSVGQTRRFSLDLGSNLNRIECRLDSAVEGAAFAVGIVKCERGGRQTYAKDNRWLGYWHNPEPAFGSIGCGVIVPDNAVQCRPVEDAKHFLIAVEPKTASTSIVYYAGAGWSRTPEFDDEKKWTAFIEAEAKRIAHPLKVEILSE